MRDVHGGGSEMTMSKLDQYRKRWLKATGEPMPESIEYLTWVDIERAVKHVEAGDTVFVATDGPVVVDVVTGGSLLDWDDRR